MSTVSEAKETIHQAIAKLNELAASALKKQQYVEVTEAVRFAEELTNIVGTQTNLSSQPQALEPRMPNPTSSRTARKPSRRNYPQFERDGDKLVKIGWSKKAKKEYEHRAPFEVTGLLLSAIRNKGADGELFTAADILPIDDVPDYQSYLALKWLYVEGVVTKHGRDRYSVSPGQLSEKSLDDRWISLPRNGQLNR